MEIASIILIFFTALIFSLVTIPLMIKFAHSRELYDLPSSNTDLEGARKRIHSRPTPRIGGIAIVAGFYFTISIWKTPSNMKAIFLCSLALFLMGLVDDLKNLSAKIKLMTQVITASVVVLSSKLVLTHIVLTPSFSLELPFVLGFLLSVFVIVGATNAINMIDGLDGLAGGAVLISTAFLSFAHYLYTKDALLLVVFSIPLIGVILGFLKYNTHPSTIFMGDSGSNWLGFMLGVFILIISNHYVVNIQEDSLILEKIKTDNSLVNSVSFVSLLLMLAIPIIDTAHVIWLRLKEGKSPIAADNRHFHHSLMKMGFTHSQSVTTAYFIMVFFALMGVLPVAFPLYSFWWLPFVGFILITALIYFTHKIDEGFMIRLFSYKRSLIANESLTESISSIIKYWEHANRYTIYLILLVTPFFIGVPAKEFGYASLAMMVIMILALFMKKTFNFLEALLLALAATVLLVSNNSNLMLVEAFGSRFNLNFAYNFLFYWLFVSTVLFFFATFRRKMLIITPTDFLLIILPLAMLLFPEVIQSEYKLNIIALRSLVLFAALRTLGIRHRNFFYKVHIICIFALLWISLISLAGLRIIY